MRFGAERMWRAEVDVQTSSGRVVPVYFYEVYWAPLTEGKITLRETLATKAFVRGSSPSLQRPRIRSPFMGRGAPGR